MKRKNFLREMFSMDDLDEDYEDYEAEDAEEDEDPEEDGDDIESKSQVEDPGEDTEEETDPEDTDEEEPETSAAEAELHSEAEVSEEEDFPEDTDSEEPETGEDAEAYDREEEDEPESSEEVPEDEEYPEEDGEEEDEDYADEEEGDEEEEEDEEDEEDDDEEDPYYLSAEYKRERRHKRRVRNQALAFLALALVVFLLMILVMQLGSGLIKAGKNGAMKGGTGVTEGTASEETSQIPALETEESVVISEPESEGLQEPLSPLDQIVTAAIAEMPLEDKVSALFFATPEQLTGVSVATQAGNTTQKILQQYKVGGLLYTGNNAKNKEQLAELLSKTAAMDPGVFLAVAERGGDASPIASALKLDAQPAALDIALSGGTDQATASGSAIGTYLKEYGFNLDLAPVSDVAVEASDASFGKNTFGPDGNLAGQMSGAFIRGLSSAGVSACISTFPGYGAAVGDEKEGMVTTTRTKEEMEAAEFISYKAAIEAGAEFLQIGTVSAPGLTGDNTQCCLSGEAVRVVREELGFQGVIVTGALNTAAVTLYYDSADAAVRALQAGCDMLFVPEKFEEAYNGVLEAVNNGTLSQERIDESLMRIYRVKYKDRVSQ